MGNEWMWGFLFFFCFTFLKKIEVEFTKHKRNYFEAVIQWHLVSHSVVQLLPLSTCKTIFVTSEGNLVPRKPSLPIPWKWLIYILSLWISLFGTFHIHESYDMWTFDVWLFTYILFSIFRHIVACISTLFLFIAEEFSIVYI